MGESIKAPRSRDPLEARLSKGHSDIRPGSWIQAIEFVHDYAHLGSGQGGYNEDHEFCGNRMSI